MSATMLRVRVWVSRHRLRLVVTAVLIGLVGGMVMGVAMGTRRTESAPDRYTRDAGGDPDLMVTQLSGAPLTDRIAELPGVTSTQAIVFVPAFLLSPVDGTLVFEPNAFAGDDDAYGARVVEGRFTDPSDPDEFTVNREMAAMLKERFGTRVGDQFQVASFDQDQILGNFDSMEEPAVPPFTATLVGITQSPAEFDQPSQQMVFSRGFLTGHPEVGIVQSLIATRLEDGVRSADVLDAVRQLPNGGDAYAVSVRVVSDSARRAVRFQATALWLVTALSLVAAAVVIAQLIARTLRIGDDERRSMLAIGWRRGDLAVERAVEGALAAMIAAPIAVAVAYAVTPMFPIGPLRSLEPQRGARMDWGIAAAGVGIVVVVVVAAAAVVALRQPRGAAGRGRVDAPIRAPIGAAGGMSLSVGAGFASSGVRGRRSWAPLLGGAVSVAGLLGSAIVGLSLTSIVDHPDRWGLNYDQLFGNPYTGAEGDIVAPILDNPSIDAIIGANIGAMTIDGAETATIGFESAKGGLTPTVLRGRAPDDLDEIGLGGEVARRLDVDIGDEVEVVGSSGEARELSVVGIVVTPDSAGNGAAMTFAAYREMNPGTTVNVVLVDFRDGAPASAIDEVAAANFSPPNALVTPTSVRALERVTAAPFLLGLVLTALLVVSSAYLLATSVRARRRDLAILRALGSDSRQLRRVVHWQASLVVAAILLVGIPLGVALGRWVVRLMTSALGIVPGADVPPVMIGLVAVVPFVVVNVLALVPARSAARVRITQLALER